MVDYRREPAELQSVFEPTHEPKSGFGFEFTALRITVIYLIVGMAALFFSDLVLPSLFVDPFLARFQAAKGFLEVLITALLIFGLTRASRRSLLQTNLELETSRRELGVLHRILRHNLRNDLTVVGGYADLVQAEVSSSELKNHCHTIKETCDEFTGSIEKAKYLSDLHSSGSQNASIDLTNLFERLADELTSEYPDAEIEMACHASGSINVKKHFDFSLEEIISNAIDHNPSEEPSVRVTADVPPGEPERIRITVTDNGPGIPEGEIAALQQWDETQLVHGSGVGLWVAQLIFLKSGCTFEIENTESGCRVSVSMERD